MMIEIKEPWHFSRRYVYLADTEEKAIEMYREDIKSDPDNPANFQSAWARQGRKHP